MMGCMLTDCKAKTKGDVPDGIDRSVDRPVPNVNQVSQFRHHGTVNHSNGETQSQVRPDEMCNVRGEWDLGSSVGLYRYSRIRAPCYLAKSKSGTYTHEADPNDEESNHGGEPSVNRD